MPQAYMFYDKGGVLFEVILIREQVCAPQLQRNSISVTL